MNYLTPYQLLEILTIQEDDAFEGRPHRRLGEIALSLGYLSQSQIDSILDMGERQRSVTPAAGGSTLSIP